MIEASIENAFLVKLNVTIIPGKSLLFNNTDVHSSGTVFKFISCTGLYLMPQATLRSSMVAESKNSTITQIIVGSCAYDISLLIVGTFKLRYK